MGTLDKPSAPYRAPGMVIPEDATVADLRAVLTALEAKKSVVTGESVNAEFEALKAGRAQVGNSVAAAMEDPEKQSQKITFAEAVAQLNSVGFNLEKARTEAVQFAQQCGLVKALQAKGVVQTADQYGALFDKTTFTPKGLKALKESLTKGEKQLPIFNPGHLDYAELWEVLIKAGKIPFWSDTYGYKNIKELRKIDPRKIQNLANLHLQTGEDQLEAFKTAYEKSAPLTAASPSVVFTPNQLEVSIVNKSATQHAQAALNGAQFLDAKDDLIRWITQRQQTGKNPDTKGFSQDPLSVFPNGGVAGLDVDDGRLGLYYGLPGYALSALGPRAVLA